MVILIALVVRETSWDTIIQEQKLIVKFSRSTYLEDACGWIVFLCLDWHGTFDLLSCTLWRELQSQTTLLRHSIATSMLFLTRASSTDWRRLLILELAAMTTAVVAVVVKVAGVPDCGSRSVGAMLAQPVSNSGSVVVAAGQCRSRHFH
jgi:hypothetical protein